MFENNIPVCAFTGHRNYDYFEQVLETSLSFTLQEEIRALLDCGVRDFLCGMAQGFDLAAAEVLLSFREKYKNIRLTAVIPCSDQPSTFTKKNKLRYEKILCACHDIVVLNESYFKGCMQQRDRYLVDNSNVLLCFLRKSSGGTYYTVHYAEKQGKRIIRL